MNEPYSRVHSQEDSNNTLGSIGRHTAINLAFAGAAEAGIYAGAKHINQTKHPLASQTFKDMAHHPGQGGKVMSALTAGSSTKKGRMVNYGGSVIGGILMGSLESRGQ